MRRVSRLGVVVCCIFLTALGPAGGAFLQASLRTDSSTARTVQATVSNIDWHSGSPQSTPEVTVSYAENYYNIQVSNNGPQTPTLAQSMQLNYNDGTQATVEFQFFCAFAPGGLDMVNQQVLNWSKLIAIYPIIRSNSQVNNTQTSSYYSFQGFYIVSGNATQVSYSMIGNSNSSMYVVNNIIGTMSYFGNTGKIGNVILSAVPYSYQGKTLQESVATFNVTLNSVIGNNQSFMSAPSSMATVPTVLAFRVTHNINQTTYKYGAYVDWSTAKAFPTITPLHTGQDISLVAQDVLGFAYGNTNRFVKHFSTDSNNDTASYLLGGKELCRELFTTQYTINGDPQVHNTTRVYIANAGQDWTGTISAVYVIFDGLKYNETTGFTFDPEVITLNTSVSSTNWGLIIGLSIGGTAVGIAAVLLVRRRRRRTLIETVPSNSLVGLAAE